MCVVLLESTDTGEASQGTSKLVTVQHTEICIAVLLSAIRLIDEGVPDGKLLVGVGKMLEHEAVTRAVHGLESESHVLGIERKHVLL